MSVGVFEASVGRRVVRFQAAEVDELVALFYDVSVHPVLDVEVGHSMRMRVAQPFEKRHLHA